MKIEEKLLVSHCKSIQSCFRDHVCPVMKHFYPDRRGLFQDDDSSSHKVPGVTEWFDEYENEANYVLWSSQSPDLNPVETYGD